jgi:hypothetical protein
VVSWWLEADDTRFEFEGDALFRFCFVYKTRLIVPGAVNEGLDTLTAWTSVDDFY